MSTFEHGYALLVGVGADLPETERDARRVAEILIDPLRCAYRPQNVRLLTGPEANRPAVLAGLNWLAERSRNDPHAAVVFYYSGHGLAEPATLLLHPCFGKDCRTLPEKYAAEGLPGDLFCRRLAEIVSRKLLVLLDCCHAAGIVETFRDPAVEPSFVARLVEGRGRVVLAASTSDEKARIGDRSGIFTEALLEGLAGYRSTSDGYARVFDITSHVQKEVGEKSRGQQHPVFKCSDVEDNFAVAFFAAGQPLPKLLGPERPLPRQTPQGFETEAERRLYLGLVKKEEEKRRLENEITDAGGPAAPPAQKARRRQLEEEILSIEGQLELLPQQSPYHQQLSIWWTWAGTANFVITLLAWGSMQSQLRGALFGQANRASISVVAMILSGFCLFQLFFVAAAFRPEEGRGTWNFRLPVPFRFKYLHFDPLSAKKVQLLILVFFFVWPLVFHVHGFRKIADQSLYAYVGEHQPFQEKYDIQGIAHWTRYFSPSDSFFGDRYALGKRGIGEKDGHPFIYREGLTYFPFWGTWILTLAFVLWTTLFLRLLVRSGLLKSAARRQGA